MNILHIANHLNTGGITTYLLTLVREQVRSGHRVYVRASAGTRLEDFRESCAGVTDHVPRCKSELSPRLWAQLPELVSFLKRNSIDIIHTHTRVAQVLSAAASGLTKVPYISTAHMFYKPRLGRRLFPCWGKAVIAISKTMERGLFDIFGREALPPVTVVENGIDVGELQARIERTDRREVRRSYGYDDGHIVVLSLCRIVPVKGIHILIDAFDAARKKIPQLRLLIAGTGDENYLTQLREQTSRLGLSDIVRFIGDIRQTEKPFKTADIFVGPYLWPEAFGLALLEAMAAGLPVIGSKSGGIAELLGNGRHGLLFEEGDDRELTLRILDYAKDPALRARMGSVAGQAAWAYSSRQMEEQVRKVYEAVKGGAR